MALVLKDKNGTEFQIAGVGKPGAPGKDGASAYQAAVAGGYTGTEEEFNERLAKGVFVGTGPALATGWEGQQNTVAVTGLPADVTGIVGVAGSADDSAWQAAVAAVLRPVSQAAGSVTLKALGTPPDVDIPIALYYWPDTGSPVLLSMFPGGGEQVPLDAPTEFAATAGNAQVTLTWTDPKDKYATPEGETTEEGDQLVSQWAYTRIIRKTGSQPTGPNDGVLVVESSVRDQYKTTGYVDSGLANDTTYYYGAFAYNGDGVVSPGAFTSAAPTTYNPVFSENSWAEIGEACANGQYKKLFEDGDWKPGDTKSFTVNEVEYTAVILDHDHDDLADGSGKAPITFALKGYLPDTYNENDFRVSQRTTDQFHYQYRYSGSNVYNLLENTIFPQIQEDLKGLIKTVTKASDAYSYYLNSGQSTGSRRSAAYSYTANLFLFSCLELGGTSTVSTNEDFYASAGTAYPYFSTNANRNTGVFYPSSSMFGSDFGASHVDPELGHVAVQAGGTLGYLKASSSAFDVSRVCFGFCI